MRLVRYPEKSSTREKVRGIRSSRDSSPYDDPSSSCRADLCCDLLARRFDQASAQTSCGIGLLVIVARAATTVPEGFEWEAALQAIRR